MADLEYELALNEDKSKDLRRGKQVFMDEDNHRWYLTADEVKELDQPKSVRITIAAA